MQQETPNPVRRSFTAEYRARVVAEYEAAPDRNARLTRELAKLHAVVAIMEILDLQTAAWINQPKKTEENTAA